MASTLRVRRFALPCLLIYPAFLTAQTPLENCSEQFIDDDVGNAPTIGNSASNEPFLTNEHQCYRDDGVSFFAMEYWPEEFAPRWLAYKLSPENYGSSTLCPAVFASC